MAGKSKLSVLQLTEEEKHHLAVLRQARSEPHRKVERANILWHYHAGLNPSAVAQRVRVSRVTVYHCPRKALAMGVEAGLNDAFHRPRPRVITPADQAWVVHLACSKPKELGYAAELWTHSALAADVRKQAVASGHPSVARAAKATVQRILAREKLQPHKIKYYLEKRDPEIEAKTKEVLIVYHEVQLQNQAAAQAAKAGTDGPDPTVITVSVDEKPGLQATATTAPHSGQSPVPPLPRDPRLSGHAAQPVPLRAYAQTWLLAEFGGNALWQDGPHLPAPNPGGLQS